MSLYYQACRKGDVLDGRIVNSGRHVMVAHIIISDKDYVLRGAAAMAVYLSKFSIISEKNYVEPSDDPVCACVSLRRPFRLEN